MCLAACIGAVMATMALFAWEWGEEKYDQASEAFIVREIETFNDGAVSPKRIEAMAQARKNMNLLSLDLLEMQNRLEKMAFIEKASVEREFPNQLKIRVWERQPELCWNRRPDLVFEKSFDELTQEELKELIRSRIFIDSEGVAMEAPPEWFMPGGPAEKCISIVDVDVKWFGYGRTTREPRILKAIQLKKLFERSPLSLETKISQISFAEDRTLQVFDQSGARLVFSKDHIDLSMLHWIRVAEVGRLSGKRIDFIDLSITNNCPVTWKDLQDVASMR
jgi:ribosome recycling factor